jgi:hypothetical protein
LNPSEGDVLTAFVVLDDRILSSTDTLTGITPIDGSLIAIESLKSDLGFPPPLLTPALCQSIIVRTTPMPSDFVSHKQPLSQLGIVNAIRANAHRAAIYQQMKSIGYEILISIATGPNITILDSCNSVFNSVILPSIVLNCQEWSMSLKCKQCGSLEFLRSGLDKKLF